MGYCIGAPEAYNDEAAERLSKRDCGRRACTLRPARTSARRIGMPDGDRKYVRVYYSIIDDERFERVYPEPLVLGTWLRLLLLADAMWPAPAPLPFGISRRALDRLVNVGIVELGPAQHYRIHGMSAERERRSEAGRIGGLASGRSRATGTVVERSLNGNEPSRAEQSRDEQNKATQRRLPPFDDLVKGFPK